MTTQLLEPIAEPILIDGLSWREFKAVEQLIDRPGIRLSFLEGVLEIRKMPGKKHETTKRRIATLLDDYLEFIGIDYTPIGSMTLENEAGQVKREADESYELGPNRERPDLRSKLLSPAAALTSWRLTNGCKFLKFGSGKKGSSLYTRCEPAAMKKFNDQSYSQTWTLNC